MDKRAADQDSELVALLEQERVMFRAEVAAGAAELAEQDRVISDLVRSRDAAVAERDAARARVQQLIIQRDAARTKVQRLRATRARLVAQRDAALAELTRYRASRMVRITARVAGRLRRLRGRP